MGEDASLGWVAFSLLMCVLRGIVADNTIAMKHGYVANERGVCGIGIDRGAFIACTHTGSIQAGINSCFQYNYILKKSVTLFIVRVNEFRTQRDFSWLTWHLHRAGE